ncbi:ornithine cyclodeaminase [Nocardioides soli]|uniref:Ornithine cyclodeaminase/alanine dehydrogenase-like protein (Mu-crystallin family) n=1 Tax=Nocardioides soli TaxID=1036020 RepID=A0A7W4W0R6_9ACTN|nr:ornithine cyclodeaminase [Nocardioides soli]MBB3045353.1 ornithine cyclodeaminase/alanine dehydrogenase-like protein (mu-crystallin family) [Nocardioides soli]
MRLSTDPQPLHVSSADIAEHVSLDLAIEAARTAALAVAEGAVTTRRSQLFFEGGWMRVMSAEVSSLGVFGYKEFHLAGDRLVRYAVHVFDTASGRPLGIVDAARITALRTAATAAVAVRHLLRDRSSVRLGVVGTGSEALTGVQALSRVVSLDEIRATSRSAVNREQFADAVHAETGHVVAVSDSVEKVLADVDVVYVATNSGGRVVLTHDDVARVGLVASIGSTLPVQRELEGAVLANADRVVLDTYDVLEESGDAIEAIGAGWDTSGATLLGTALGAPTPAAGERVVYKSIGSPEQDLVLAARIVQHAAAAGFGRRIDPLSAVKENL